MYQNSTKNQFISFISLNVDSSFNIKDRLFKFSVVVLGIITTDEKSGKPEKAGRMASLFKEYFLIAKFHRALILR